MTRRTTPQSYEEQFGPVEFRDGDPGRSALSPAAYLADLLQLVSDNFEAEAMGRRQDLRERRPDLWHLPLDGHHTNTMLPRLDIINERLAAEMGRTQRGTADDSADGDGRFGDSAAPLLDQASQTLRQSRYPLSLPVDLTHQRVRHAIELHGQDPVRLRRLFARDRPDALAEALDALGLDPVQADEIVHAPVDAAAAQARAREAFAMVDVTLDDAPIWTASGFARASGLTRAQVEELFFGGTSVDARSPDGAPERTRADQLFVHAGLDGTMKLDPDSGRIRWSGSAGDRWSWLDRASRLIRLSRWTGEPLVALDRFLRTVGDRKLDREALRRLAIVRSLGAELDIPLDEASALAGDLDALGVGDDRRAPADPFNRVFNVHTHRDRRWFAPATDSAVRHAGFATPTGHPFRQVRTDQDLLSDDARPLRRRLAQALHLSEEGLKDLVRGARGAARRHGRETSLLSAGQRLLQPALSLLYRLARLADATELEPRDLVLLIAVVEADRSLAERDRFTQMGWKPLPDAQADKAWRLDGWELLERGPVGTRLDFVRTVAAMGGWMAEIGIEAGILRSLLQGDVDPRDDLADDASPEERDAAEAAALALRKDRLERLRGLLTAFAPLAFRPALLEERGLAPRLAREAARVCSEAHRGLVVPHAPTVLSGSTETLPAAALDAVVGTLAVHRADLRGTGVAARYAARIHARLVETGALDPAGRIRVERDGDLPAVALDVDLSHLHAPLRAILASLHADAAREAGPAGALEIEVFASDLDALDATPAERAELLEVLQDHGVVGPGGWVLRPDALRNGARDVPLDGVLGALTETVEAHLQHALERFDATPLPVDTAALAALDLEADEAEALLQNLVFNGHLDESGHVADKRAMARLAREEFDLGLRWMSLRDDVHRLLVSAVDALAERELRVSASDLEPLAAASVAETAWQALHGTWLEDGQVRPGWGLAFRDPVQAARFDLGVGALATDGPAVAAAVAAVLDETSDLRVQHADLEALGLSPDDAAAMFVELVDAGLLEASGCVPTSEIPFYVEPDHVESFSVQGAEDYERELFFVLHRVARAVSERAAQVETAVAGIQGAQEAAVQAALAESLGLDAELAAVVLAYTVGSGGRVATRCMPPILTNTDVLGALHEEPPDGALRVSLGRAGQLALLTQGLGLSARGLRVALLDRQIASRMPERVALSAEDPRITAVLVDDDGRVLVFHGDQVVVHDGVTGAELESARPVSTWCADVRGRVDAAFRDSDGATWVLSGPRWLKREAGEERFSLQTGRSWGHAPTPFDDPARIDAAVVDGNERLALFVGDRYLRVPLSGFPRATEDTPLPEDPAEAVPASRAGDLRRTSGYWHREAGVDAPAARLLPGISAAARAAHGDVVCFQGDRYWSSAHPTEDRAVADRWGRLDGPRGGAERLDTLVGIGDRLYAVRGGWCAELQDALDAPEVRAVQGTWMRLTELLPGAPAWVNDGIDCGFTGWDGRLHLFRDDRSATLGPDGAAVELEAEGVAGVWGQVDNPLFDAGRVDAVLAGLDGRVYVFSGPLVYRFSGRRPRRVDAGWPRPLADSFVGLETVDAAFVMDGKTYIFGTTTTDGASRQVYQRWSTGDTTAPDEGFPRPVHDDFWSLPESTKGGAFSSPDAVFTDPSGTTWLFAAEQCIRFEHDRRWWSQPESIQDAWPGLPLQTVGAAFVGRDGRICLVSAPADADTPRDQTCAWLQADGTLGPDGRTASPVAGTWGVVRDELSRTGRVEAAFAVRTVRRVEDDGPGSARLEEARQTYLLSGDQVYRWTHASGYPIDYRTRSVDPGFPRDLSEDLTDEPCFARLGEPLRGPIRGAWADDARLVLVEGDALRILDLRGPSDVDASGPPPRPLDPGSRTWLVEDGALYRLDDHGWAHVPDPERSRLPREDAPVEGDLPAPDPLTPHAGVATAPVASADRAPRCIARLTPELRRDVDALLEGADGNTYGFRGGQVYDADLGAFHDVSGRWGQPANPTRTHDRVDAALLGRDGRLYLFAGEHFLTFSLGDDWSGADAPAADGPPRRIADHWGGLQTVRHAWTLGEQTVLVEEDPRTGELRYQEWRGSHYGAPVSAQPYRTDARLWGLPDTMAREGFADFDCVRVTDDERLFFKGDRFLRYDVAREQWTGPQPVTRLLGDLPEVESLDGVPTALALRAIVALAGGTQLLFTRGSWSARSGDGSWAPLQASGGWGGFDNAFESLGRVDAAWVRDGRTFLFSGDQYARYSTADYTAADPGYPKTIADNLRLESPFSSLRAELEATLATLDRGGRRVRGIWATEGTLSLVLGEDDARILHVGQLADDLRVPTERVGRLRNALQEGGDVDAALRTEDGALWLVSGDQVYRYADPDQPYVDSGYPRPLWPALGSAVGAPLEPAAVSAIALPDEPGETADLRDGIDAAFTVGDAQLWLFQGRHAFRLSPGPDGPALVAMPIKGTFGRIDNPFATDEGEPNPSLDAAFVGPDGAVWALKDGLVARAASMDSATLEPGYPAPASDVWPVLPPGASAPEPVATPAEPGDDALMAPPTPALRGFVFDGRTTLVRGRQHVRYSDPTWGKADPGYPAPLSRRWCGGPDLRVEDVVQLHRLVGLDASAGPGEPLLGLIDPEGPVEQTPYSMVAQGLETDVADVRWLKVRDAFLQRGEPGDRPAGVDSDLLLRVGELVSQSVRLQTSPAVLHAEVWEPLYGAAAPSADALESARVELERLLAVRNPGSDLEAIQTDLHTRSSTLRREACVDWLLARGLYNDRTLASDRELSAHLLLDVQTDPPVQVSRITEAIGAVQLFVHRYFAQLEDLDARGDDDQRRRQMKKWWQWMRNYRVWEANRKVFLYPESYIRPELRDTRSAAFKQLEQDLLKGDGTDPALTRAYRTYLDEFTSVSGLHILGGYLDEDPNESGAQRALLVGRSPSEPFRYYHRTAWFREEGQGTHEWQPWSPVDINNAAVDLFYPVRAFGRIFIFWLETQADTVSTSLTVPSTGGVMSSGDKVKQKLLLKFVYDNLDGSWKTAQGLRLRSFQPGHSRWAEGTPVALSAGARAADGLLYVHARSGTAAAPSSIDVHWSLGGENGSVRLTGDLVAGFVPPADRRSPWRVQTEDLEEILTEPHGVDAKLELSCSVGSGETGWFAFRDKGGSFLAKPAERSLTAANAPFLLAGNGYGLPPMPGGIAAAVQVSDTERWFFERPPEGEPAHQRYFVARRHPGEPWPVLTPDDLVDGDARWRRVGETLGHDSNVVLEHGRVDGAVATHSQLLLIAPGEGETRTFIRLPIGAADDDAHVDAPARQELAHWNWDELDSIVRASSGNYIEFRRDGTFGLHLRRESSTIAERFGPIDNGLSAPDADPLVVGAFHVGEAVYLVGTLSTRRWVDATATRSAPVSPQSGGLRALAAALGVSDTAALPETPIVSAYDHGGGVEFVSDDRRFRLDPATLTFSEPEAVLDATGATARRLHADGDDVVAVGADVRDGEGDDVAVVPTSDAVLAIGADRWLHFRGTHVSELTARQHAAIEGGQVRSEAPPAPATAGGVPDADALRQADAAARTQALQGAMDATADPVAPRWCRDQRIQSAVSVRAAYRTGDHIHLCFRDEDRAPGEQARYLRVPANDAEWSAETVEVGPDGDVSWSQVGSPHGLPQWPEGVDAAAAAGDRIWFFEGTRCRSSDMADDAPDLSTAERFGRSGHHRVDHAIVSAYATDEHVYLAGGGTIIRHAKTPDGVSGSADPGWTATGLGDATDLAVLQLRRSGRVGRWACVRGSTSYAFDPTGGSVGAELGPLATRWKNIPAEFHGGLDATLYTHEPGVSGGDDQLVLYLFRGGQASRFVLDSADHAEPYALAYTTYEFIRTTTTSSTRMATRLLSDGIEALLSLDTQTVDEIPRMAFGAGRGQTIGVVSGAARELPSSTQLDFSSANGPYYWEVFLHAPMLVASTLRSRKHYEQAKTWYERLFDPSSAAMPWRVLPLADDAAADPHPDANRDTEQALQSGAQRRIHLDDPADAHALARIRTRAYRKAVVVAAVDNLIDWGDALFTAHTRESVNEAAMLYHMAYDLLGPRPQPLPASGAGDARTAAELGGIGDDPWGEGLDFLLYVTAGDPRDGRQPASESYFHLPGNAAFLGCWERVEDRLHKLRNAMDIHGISRPMPLFEPAIDPLALARAAAGGGGLGGGLAGGGRSAVPPYRYAFLLPRVHEVVQRAAQLGEQLLAAVEKQDTEALQKLQAEHEQSVLALTTKVHAARIREAQLTRKSLEGAARQADIRLETYTRWTAQGYNLEETIQQLLQGAAIYNHAIATVFNFCAAFVAPIPRFTFGPFSFGTDVGGQEFSDALGKWGQSFSGIAEALQIGGEMAAARGQHERMLDEWALQIQLAVAEREQIRAQAHAADLAVAAAEADLEVLQQQQDNAEAVRIWYDRKWTNSELYAWTEGQLSNLYQRTYQLAVALLREARTALVYERGVPETDLPVMAGGHWEPGRKGLLAASRLALEVDLLDQAVVSNHKRPFEITRTFSLSRFDPKALFRLIDHGTCDFSLTEEMYDRDFPGHYRRQLKTVAVVLQTAEGVTANATLTQVHDQLVLRPDPKALRFLLTGEGETPTSIRGNWRPSQQVAFSEPDEYGFTTGLFELRFDTDRFLPFEGTGAVSRWRLQLSGPDVAEVRRNLTDVAIKVRYTAFTGGDAFAAEVHRALRPAPRARLFDVATDFPEAWEQAGATGVLELPLTRALFPSMVGGRIHSALARIQGEDVSGARLVWDQGDAEHPLPHGSEVDTTGLRLGRGSTPLRLRFGGDLRNVSGLLLVLGYTAGS
jgi:hypothetical protein